MIINYRSPSLPSAEPPPPSKDQVVCDTENGLVGSKDDGKSNGQVDGGDNNVSLLSSATRITPSPKLKLILQKYLQRLTEDADLTNNQKMICLETLEGILTHMIDPKKGCDASLGVKGRNMYRKLKSDNPKLRNRIFHVTEGLTQLVTEWLTDINMVGMKKIVYSENNNNDVANVASSSSAAKETTTIAAEEEEKKEEEQHESSNSNSNDGNSNKNDSLLFKLVMLDPPSAFVRANVQSNILPNIRAAKSLIALRTIAELSTVASAAANNKTSGSSAAEASTANHQSSNSNNNKTVFVGKAEDHWEGEHLVPDLTTSDSSKKKEKKEKLSDKQKASRDMDKQELLERRQNKMDKIRTGTKLKTIAEDRNLALLSSQQIVSGSGDNSNVDDEDGCGGGSDNRSSSSSPSSSSSTVVASRTSGSNKSCGNWSMQQHNFSSPSNNCRYV